MLLGAVAVIAVLLCGACASEPMRRQPDLAMGDELLGPSVTKGREPTVVGRGELRVMVSGSARVELLNRTNVVFAPSTVYAVPDASLVRFLVQHGDIVEVGTPLAEVQANVESLNAQIAVLDIEVSQGQTALSQARTAQAAKSRDLAKRLTSETRTSEREILMIQLNAHESKSAAENARAERALGKKREERALYQSLLEPYVIESTVRGQIVDIASMAAGYPIAPGDKLACILELDVYQLVMNARAVEFRLGMPVTVTAADGEAMTGRVASIPSAASENERLVPIVLQLDTPLEPIEKYVTQHFAVSGETVSLADVLVVPEKALRTENDKPYAMMLVDGEPQKRFVRTGVSGGGMVHVVYGLNAGDALVAE